MAFKSENDKAKDKAKSLEDQIAFLAKEAETCFVDLSKVPDQHPAITSGSMVVDMYSGIGGLPVGGCVEIAGEWSAGKTTLALCCAAAVQRSGGRVLFVDFENAFDKMYAESLGVDTTPAPAGKFILLQPRTLEEGWNWANKLMRTGEIQLCIIDSIAAGIPDEIVNGEAGDGRIASQSALLAPEYNKMASTCNRTRATCLFLNQIRIQMEKQGRNTLVSKDTSGGNALKHYCLMRIWLTIVGKIEDTSSDKGEKNYVANKVRFQFIKNKCGKPYLMGTLIIRYGAGIDNESALLETGVEEGLVKQSGSYFIVEGLKRKDGQILKVQGREPMRDRIANDTELREYLVNSIKELNK